MVFKSKTEEKLLDLDAAIQGTLSFKDPVNLCIRGKFEGSLHTRGNLTIGPTATVIADIVGDNITVGGSVKGKITAKGKLALLPTAIVEGEIHPAKLNISEGAVFDGRCLMLNDLLNVDELARYLEVDLNSVLDWVNQGKIPVVKEGGEWRFERNAIDSWVTSEKIA